MNLYLGIDVGKSNLAFCALDSDRQCRFQDETTNDLNGARQIKQTILAETHHQDYNQIIAGMEATSIYNFHPMTFLSTDPELKALGLTVIIINPYTSHHFSQLFDDGKTDKIDARHLADLLRVEPLGNPVMRQEKYVALQRLTRERYHLVRQLTDSKNHFLNNLYYRCNTLDQTVPTSVFGATMLTLLTDEELSLDEAAALPLAQLVDHLQRLSHGKFGDTEAVAKAIKQAVRSSYRLTKVVADSVNEILAVYAEEIRMLNKQIKSIDKTIAQVSSQVKGIQCLTSVPGIGPVYAAGIVAELGQIERFPDESHIAKYAGLAWLPHESGTSVRQKTPHTRKGNQYLRYYLVEAANSVRRYDTTYQRYYQKKYNEVPKYRHQRAAVLTARKLVRLVEVLLKNRQLYTAPPVA
ncbi:IS110 family transposase [Loigolactobacillus coryniformis subsp. torquens DSM 20004 = KCTC 3535]|uniref:IS110 family transposase n=2 Tax=Loigolactobacillus coryniformis TaxID=1610 RepID=A0A2D1KR83_9LACO|nr:IS110 family transposase [Loigolactobacillus coryniformis]ATO44637.1 IS110 family transposase [Loigolactobacillus coryniformis subsp. torquens DSM 20004 = KCTC 3535]